MNVVSGRKCNKTRSVTEGLLVGCEDHIVVDEDKGFAMVIDGHGGSLCVDFVATHAQKRLEHHLSEKGIFLGKDAESVESKSRESANEEDVEESDLIMTAMLETFASIEEEFLLVAERTGDTSGAVCIMALVRGETCFLAHLGDCRAIMRTKEASTLRKSRKAKSWVQLTADHRVNFDGPEKERVVQAGGTIVDGRICSLTPARAFGDWDIKKVVGPDIIIAVPEVSMMEILEPMTILIASDGVWDSVTNHRAMEIAEKFLKDNPKDANAAAVAVTGECVSNTRDDVSALVISFDVLS